MSTLDPNNWEDMNNQKYEHWKRLKAVRKEFVGDTDEFLAHLKEIHGIELILDSDGNITEDHIIVDDHKYFLFMLKYV